MSYPNPPFIEFGFYFANLGEAKVFNTLVLAAIRLGATFTGYGMVHRGPRFGSMPFAAITDFVQEKIEILDYKMVEHLLIDKDTRLVQIAMNNVIDTVGNSPEIITYLSLPEDLINTEHHPFAIRAEGDVFAAPPGIYSRDKVREAGLMVFERFCKIVDTVRPSYATITVEYALESPLELQRDLRSLAFRDFFVSGQFLKEDLIAVKKLYLGAYIESLADGLYVSCTNHFNPIARHVKAHTAVDLSVKMAKMIAQASCKSSLHDLGKW